MRLDLIFDQCTRPSEDVATTADVLDMVGWKKEAEMLRGRFGLCRQLICVYYCSIHVGV